MNQSDACRVAREQQASDGDYEESVDHTFAVLSAASTPLLPERHAPEAHTGRIEDGVCHRRNHRLARRFAGAVMRQVGPIRIRIAVDHDDVDLRRRVHMR
jgi:hypothetical protein